MGMGGKPVARVKIEDIIGELESPLSRALENALRKAIPDAEFSRRSLFKAFKREVGRKCSTWERVRDNYAEN
jgi:hypothetical protein